MKYNELYSWFWDNFESEMVDGEYRTNKNELYNELSEKDKKAYKLIRMLEGRGGFDHWWEGIDSDIQNEIFEEIKSIIDE